MILSRAKIPRAFSDAVLREAEALSRPDDVSDRTDFRGEWVYTIDGADAKDLDDAIHVKRLENGDYELGVHIADVSHYVREKTLLDASALERATSVYLGLQVIPMLPERLSNDLCSLHPGTPKLTQSVVMRISPDGHIRTEGIYESVIESRYRFTYDEVQEILDENRDISEYPDELVASLRHARDLFRIIEKKRIRSGKLALELAELILEYRDPYTISGTRPRVRGDAHRIIEEFMISANEAVAHAFYQKKLPFLYRVHERPDPEKLDRLSEILSHYGFPCDAGALTDPVFLGSMVEKIAKTRYAPLLRYVLTSLQKAEYSEKNLGHHGLGLSHYSHFTSPIRRYPDLQIHRIIKDRIHNRLDSKRTGHYRHILPGIAADTSVLERRAERAEYDVRDTRLARYAATRLGEEAEGIVTGITEFGAYVTLDDGLEGFCFIRNLPVRTRFFEPGLQLQTLD